ncbi:MAG: ABC transporter ATP-binding protein [Lachnospiraceae bacterium]|nr:ABC transporter ATP-binding protein [Lachnospiraceae bacterium]
MTGEEMIVEMRGITKKFPGIVANDDVSISIKKGEIFAILGENGAGKSTLMSILYGMYEPDSGEIFIRGKKETISSPNYASSLNIGMVHQHFMLVSDYTIAENIILGTEPGAKALGFIPFVDMKRAEREVRELSEEYGLSVDPGMIISEAPVSVRQRVEILKMLYRKAEILIFDEPTAVLTPQEIESLLNIIKNLRDGGKTVILITHKLDEIKKVADRCAILQRGRLMGVLDVPSTDTSTMVKLMVGREMDLAVEKGPFTPGKEVLRVEDLTVKNSDGVTLVNDVSFTVHSGEIFAIAGVSGNGQTEIADAVAGLLKASSGRITLNGVDITGSSIRKRVETGLSYVPEDRHNVGMILDLELRDALIIRKYYLPPFQENGILDRVEAETYADRLIEDYDIRCSRGGETVTRSMSGGNQQKAIIAREIDMDRELAVFVQPTRGLDVGAINHIHRQIVRERDRGKAILLISLELDEVMALADTIGVVYSGRMEKIAGADKLSSNDVGEYMMGVGKK